MDSNKHNIKLENRKRLVIDGVADVISFDEETVLLDTVLGRLNIGGSDLHIQTLCVESGDVTVEGNISELIYEEDEKQTKRGFFGRLVK